MLIQIITHTPLWVWGLLTALLALGLYQSRDRQVRPLQLLALPLALLALGLSSLAPRFAAQPVLAVFWLAALGASLLMGLRLPVAAGTHWNAATQRLHLAGSWFPLVLILVIFTLRYTAAVSLAMHPAWQHDLSVQAPLSLAFGALSGLFLGRALGLRRLVTTGTMGTHGQPA